MQVSPRQLFTMWVHRFPGVNVKYGSYMFAFKFGCFALDWLPVLWGSGPCEFELNLAQTEHVDLDT